MKLFFDARMLYNSGIGRYSRNLCAGLLKSSYNIEIILAGSKEKINRFEIENNVVVKEKINYDSPVYSLDEQITGSRLAAKYKNIVSFCHFPHYNVPWFFSGRGIVTVHDIIHLHFPEYFGKLKVKIARRWILKTLQTAERIIVGSESTKKDIVSLNPKISEKIRVVNHGVNDIFKPLPKSSVHDFIQRKGYGSYMLFIGNEKPHKNLIIVLKSFDLIKNDFPNLNLILIGDITNKSFETEKSIKGLGNRVIEIQHVGDDELPFYYNGAELLIIPSLYEGFGFPALEAMACGVPVISSNRSSLAEVVCNAGIMIDPLSIKDITDALRNLLSNKLMREELIDFGIKRAKLFTWEKCVRETYDIYKEIDNK